METKVIMFPMPAWTDDQRRALERLMAEENCCDVTALVRRLLLKEVGARVDAREV